MCEVKGNEYDSLILHGGGTPQVGFLIGFFDGVDADFSTLKCKLRTSSAGSLAVLYLVTQMYMSRDQAKEAFKGVCEMFFCFSNLPSLILDTLESDRRGLQETSDCFHLLPSELLQLTFRQLQEINANVDWIVQTTIIEEGQIKERTYGSHTPDVKVVDAVAASAAVPLIFSGVDLGGVNHMDGDLYQWSLAHVDDKNFHIQSRPGVELLRELKFTTDIPFIDELLRVSCAWLSTNLKPPDIKTALSLSPHRHFTEWVSALTEDVLSPLYYDAGVLFSRDVVLK